jgi:ABC-type lipoprotein release transport system permease subunit
MIINLAWRNVWRNRSRSLAVILALASGLFGALFIAAMANGIADKTIQTSIDNELADIQLHDKDYLVMEDVTMTLEDDAIGNSLDKIQNIRSYSSRVKSGAMASTATNSRQVTLLGIDPDEEKQVSTIHQNLVDGSYFEMDTKIEQVLISSRVAEKLKVDVKSKIIFSLADKNGEIVYQNYKVCGLFKTNNSVFDETTVYVNKAHLGSILKLRDKEVHEFAIRIIDEDRMNETVRLLSEKFPGLAVRNWLDISPLLRITESSMSVFSYVLIIIVLVALIFGIINTMLMVILERTKEIGMLRSLGMSRLKIAQMIMLETIFLCLVGSVMGNVLGFLAISYFGTTGMKFESFEKGFELYGMSAKIFPVVANEFYLFITIMVVLTAIIASFFPIIRAFRLNPALAIRD